MGAREDYMAVRRAAHFLSTIASGEVTDQVTCKQRLLEKAAERELTFLRLGVIRNELIDLAWAVLGEKRPGGPATAPEGVEE